jgi:hypothetical protein
MPKGKKGAKAEAARTIVYEDVLCGTIEKFCGTGFKPRFFRLSEGLLQYSRTEPTDAGPQEIIEAAYIVNLRKKFDVQAQILDSTRELQFAFQGHVFRLRTETSELRDQWFDHLEHYLQSIRAADIIFSSPVEMVDGSAPNAFAYLQDGSMVMSSTPIAVDSLDEQAGAAGATAAPSPRAGSVELVAGMKVHAPTASPLSLSSPTSQR